MVRALLDTNILIDFLHGNADARAEIALYASPAISVVTWMEVMVGATPATEAGTRSFLSAFETIELDAAIAVRAVALRREFRLKLPDAIVWASAQVRSMLLVTRDTKGFPANDPGVRVPYRA